MPRNINALFDRGRREGIRRAIEKGDAKAFQKPARKDFADQEGPAGQGNLIASGTATAHVNSNTGLSVKFNLKESESLEIEGIRFTYRGSRDGDDDAATSSLGFDIDYGQVHQQIRIPFFDDSFFTISLMRKKVVMSPSSRGSNPDSVSGTISLEGF